MASEAKSASSQTKGKVLVKYMGIADIATVEKGETFGGQYPEGLSESLTFSRENLFVLDLSDLPKDVVDLLLEDSERFSDVTSYKRVPSNLNQRVFGGHRSTQKADEALPAPES